MGVRAVKRDDARHGTYAGALAHQKEGVALCKPCREARATYQREFRQRNGTWRDQNRARSRAVWRLVDRYRAEFERLYVEELNEQRAEKASA
jgi:hypothetical protein